MKIKMIGLGQCGSFVVYDVIAHLFNQKTSKDIRTVQQSHWKHDFGQTRLQWKTGTSEGMMNLKRYFKDLNIPDLPQFYVIDGNRNNAVIDGLQGHEINNQLAPLQVLANPLILSKRNNGCYLGQVGEFVFRQEKESSSVTNVFNKLKSTKQVDINAIVFAGGGGSGSGGVPIFNKELYSKDSLLFNLMVLPPHYISDRRQMWNAGRCIMRLARIAKQTSLLLFSNLSESLDDQFCVNQYICNLILRLAHFGYPGNLPRGATDADKKDLQVFFSGKPAFVGMSSLNKDEPSDEDLERMVEQTFAQRGKQSDYGLSVVLPDKAIEQRQFSQIKKVMIVIGLPPNYVENSKLINIIRQAVAKRLYTNPDKLDCCAYSYTSRDQIELTVFCRHNSYPSSFLLDKFLKSYFEWYEGEENEFEYLSNILGKIDNEFLDTVMYGLKQEVDSDNHNWLQAFNFEIDKDLGATYLQKKKDKVTSV
jgi:hypothetical protein